VLDRANRRDRFFMTKPLHSAARDASLHTKHVSNANVVRVVLLDANSYLALRFQIFSQIHAIATGDHRLDVHFEARRNSRQQIFGHTIG
jgi:hypothetical protein